MIRPEELAFLDATEQAELVRKKKISPLELLEAAIERIERLNPKINAVVTPMYEQARAAAAGPLPDGPFTGVPFLLKDILAPYAGGLLEKGSFNGSTIQHRRSSSAPSPLTFTSLP